MNKYDFDTVLSSFVNVVSVLAQEQVDGEKAIYKYYFTIRDFSYDEIYDSSEQDSWFKTYHAAMEEGIQRLRDYHPQLVKMAESEAKEGEKYRARKR